MMKSGPVKLLFICILLICIFPGTGIFAASNANELSFTVDGGMSSRFNLGDNANAFLVGNKLIIMSSGALESLAPGAGKYKEVKKYNHMYVMDVETEKSGASVNVSDIAAPAKSPVKIGDNFLLVNKDNPLPKNYKVDEKQLVDLKKTYKYKTSGSGSGRVRADYAAAVSKMFTDAAKAGIKNFVCNSGYRSIAYQTELFNARLSNNLKIYKDRETAIEKTRLRVAYPGTSEHNLGIAMDILQNPEDADTFKNTKEAKWLKDNCYKYGFIVRYPDGKTNYTYTMYEPWHIRYVGLPYSKLFQSTGLCFEEIVKKLKTDMYVTFNDGNNKYALFYTTTAELYAPASVSIQRSVLTYNNEWVTLIKV